MFPWFGMEVWNSGFGDDFFCFIFLFLGRGRQGAGSDGWRGGKRFVERMGELSSRSALSWGLFMGTKDG